jgi:methylase of polypeptide subunit release factors
MRYYRYSEDWISHLDGEFRARLIGQLRALPFDRLRRYPPPKITGLPVGNETRILMRFLAGKSSQLDASALSGFYRSLMSRDDRSLYRAFRKNESLSEDEWATIIGHENIHEWVANKCLTADSRGGLQCQFSVVSLDGLILAAEWLQDHGKTWEPPFLVNGNAEPSEDTRPFFHTYIGLDSLRMIEIMNEMGLAANGRYLDCGPGSGGLLLYFGRGADEAVGVDINPRAAKLAQFNAELNAMDNCKTYVDDALAIAGKYGTFDLVTWNLPFVFLPNEDEHDYIDAFGGELGIGICLKFIETLPGLLTNTGRACLEALAPITQNGENVLEARLTNLLPRLRLDCELRVAQSSVAHTRELWHFHKAHGLSKFESVYLTLQHGSGKLRRVEAPFSQRLVDQIRERMYARKYN